VQHSFVPKQNPASNAVARQVFFTQYAAKFAEKTRVHACEDKFSSKKNRHAFLSEGMTVLFVFQ
jgi:hypothetical protein